MQFQAVSKRAIWNMLCVAALEAAALSAIAATLFFVLLAPLAARDAALYWGGLGLAVLVLLALPFIRYKRYRYLIDEVRVAKCEGILFVTTEIAPIERIHQISVQRGPIDRLTGLNKVTVTTAGGEITIRFLDSDTADRLLSFLETKINVIAHAQGAAQ